MPSQGRRGEADPPNDHRADGAPHGDAHLSDPHHGGAQDRLVRAAIARDRAAFADLIRIHRSRVTRIVRRLIGSPEDAEDLTQETFVRAWSSLPRLEDPARFPSWLLGIASHLVGDHLRRRGARPEESAAEILESMGSRRLTSTASERERRRVIDAAIRALPERLRTVLVLRSLEGFDYAEIARIMQLRPATVRTQMVQARRELRRQLERALGESLELFRDRGGDA